MSGQSLRNQLLGVWSLERFIDVLEDGSVHHTLGPQATGYIAYSEPDWVSVQIMAGSRTQYGNPDITGGSPEELASAAVSYFAYAGIFTVDESRQCVIHHLLMSLIPNWTGSTQLRHVTLHDDLLILRSDPMVFDGVLHRPELRWRRGAATRSGAPDRPRRKDPS